MRRSVVLRTSLTLHSASRESKGEQLEMPTRDLIFTIEVRDEGANAPSSPTFTNFAALASKLATASEYCQWLADLAEIMPKRQVNPLFVVSS